MVYDFYSELLTDRQKNIFELYHLDDLSLNEISSECGITRQAVLDSIKRTEKLLLNYENKLSLVKRHLKQKEIINDMLDKIEKVSLASNICKLDTDYIKSKLGSLLD